MGKKTRTPKPTNIFKNAEVTRDINGIPHIVSDTEEGAWYAMGYEMARDNLYGVQLTTKSVQGRLSEFVGPSGKNNDRAVKFLKIYLSPTQFRERDLKEILLLDDDIDVPGENPNQVFLNLKAYTKGLNDYREDLRDNNVERLEKTVKAYMIARKLEWMFMDEITIHDVVSFSRWLKGTFNYGFCVSADPAAAIHSPANLPFTLPPDEDELVDEQLPRAIRQAKRIASTMQGATGSNGFCWTNKFTEQMGLKYSVCVADPQTATQPERLYKTGSDYIHMDTLGHSWYAHIIVKDTTPVLPNEPKKEHLIDVFGYVSWNSGMMFLSHNQHVATAGSAGTPNLGDVFLLRLRQDTEGNIIEPKQFYNYYKDGGTSGVSNTAWDFFDEELVPFSIKQPDGTLVSADETIHRAGPFGLVPNISQVVYAATPTPGDPKSWKLGEGGSNKLSKTPGANLLETIPCVACYRTGSDPNVDDARHFSRFSVALYRIMKAKSVFDVQQKFIDLDAGYTLNFVAVDRPGNIFASLSGAVPQRGDDDAMQQAGYNAFPDKFDLYDKFNEGMVTEPVPVRQKEDQMFDWVFEKIENNTPVNLQYLKPSGPGISANRSYLPFLLHIAGPTGQSTPDVPANMGLASTSNDNTWHAYQIRERIELKNKPGVLVNQPEPFNIMQSPDNALLNNILETGTAYHSYGMRTEALPKNQFVIDFLKNVGQTSPIDIAGAKDLAQAIKLYVSPDYPGPLIGGVVQPPTPQVKRLPVVIRTVKELFDNLSAGTNIMNEFDRERGFYRDLWQNLFQPVSGSDWDMYTIEGTTTQVNLKALWVDNINTAAFYYEEVDNPAGGAPILGNHVDFALGDNLGLIDFLWSEIRIDDVSLIDAGPGGFTPQELSDVGFLMQELIDWDNPTAPVYENASTSAAALLYEQFKRSFRAANFKVSRIWTPLFNGQGVATTELPVPGLFPDLSPPFVKVPLDPVTGFLPNFNDDDFAFSPPIGPVNIAFQHNRGFGGVGGLAFPKSTIVSSVGENTEDDTNFFKDALRDPITNFLTPPYEALYENGIGGTVKQKLAKEDINAFIEFFLKLAGAQLNSPQSYTIKEKAHAQTSGDFVKIAKLYSAAYPLTKSMAQITVLRRLLSTGKFLGYFDAVPQKPLFMDKVRSRMFNILGEKAFPQLGADAPIEGEFVRSQVLGINHPLEFDASKAWSAKRSEIDAEGFQDILFGIGGSTRTLVSLFPDEPDPVTHSAQSFFWIMPGQRIGVPASKHSFDLTENFANRDLTQTFYENFDTGTVPKSTEFKVNPVTRNYDEE
jgi:hypothetical protein